MIIRAGQQDDGPFIFNSWLRSYNEHLRPLDRRAGYWKAHKEVIADLLASSAKVGGVLVAVDPERLVQIDVTKPPQPKILGFAVGEPMPEQLVLHYVYVKDKERGKGVARSLVDQLRAATPSTSVIVTHMTTKDVRDFCRSRGWGLALHAALYRTIMRMLGGHAA